MKYISLDDVWPLPFRRLSREVVQRLSNEDFYSLCKLIYRRTRRYQSNDRKAHELVRRLILRRKGMKVFPELRVHNPDMFFAKYKENIILKSLYSDREKRWINPVNRKMIVHFDLKNFSFIDSPNNTMNRLRDIAVAECEARVGRLDFGDSLILDIGPYVVWGLMSNGMAPFLSGGKMGIPVQKVIEAVGLRKFMRMDEFKGLNSYRDIWAFPLRQRNPGIPTATPAKAIGFSKVADQLVDTVDEWLGALPVSMSLAMNARPQLNRIVTEILENAERHGRPGSEIGDWYVAGFMARREADDGNGENNELYVCHIAIVNLGITIAESISKSPDERMRTDLNRYTGRHRSRAGQSPDVLATLYAMQDGVSSLPEGRGGMGMMEMVALANELGGTEDVKRQPAITIISGRSCIRFSGPYKGYRPSPPSQKRIQPFNTEGSLDSAPDMSYVFDLDFGFPGTIVTLRFSLDYKALMEKVSPND